MKTEKNNVFLSIKSNSYLRVIFLLSLPLVILYPSNFLITSSLDIIATNSPFYKYINTYSGMASLPLSTILLFFFSFIFIFKKIYKEKESIILFICVFYSFSSLLYVIFFVDNFDLRFFKNLIQVCILVFILIVFSKINLGYKFLIYKFYNFILTFLCALNLINLIIFYNVIERIPYMYFNETGYLSGYLNQIITHFSDYFPFVVFLSLVSDFFFLKKHKKLVLFFIFYKILWYLISNYYSVGFAASIINKGLFVCVLFLIVSCLFLKIINLKISQIKIFNVFILINFVYYFMLLILYNYLDSSLQDRAEAFFYVHYELNIQNILIPFTMKYGFEHNLHNDFWDIFFTFGLISFLIYFYLSKIFYDVYKSNKYSFLVLFSTFCIGSLVQNNLLNIYTIFNFALMIFLVNKKKATT